jgi:hypothetical protein
MRATTDVNISKKCHRRLRAAAKRGRISMAKLVGQLVEAALAEVGFVYTPPPADDYDFERREPPPRPALMYGTPAAEGIVPRLASNVLEL